MYNKKMIIKMKKEDDQNNPSTFKILPLLKKNHSSTFIESITLKVEK